jgi:hypothetical protein
VDVEKILMQATTVPVEHAAVSLLKEELAPGFFSLP